MGLSAKDCSKSKDKVDKVKKEAEEKAKKLNSFKNLAAKKALKKVASLPLKAVPIIGWAMLAYDVYDTVTTGLDLIDIVKENDDAIAAVIEAVSELDMCEKSKTAEPVGKGDGPKVKRDEDKKEVKEPNKKQQKNREPQKYENKKENPDGSTTYTVKDSKTGKLHDVKYDKNGYPDFSEHKYTGNAGKSEVQIDMKGNHKSDFKAANEKAGFRNTKGNITQASHPEGYTWHHHQDGKTMQLVEKGPHNNAPHTGGVSKVK